MPIDPQGTLPTAQEVCEAARFNRNEQPVANIIALYKIFRRDKQPIGRFSILLSVGHPDIQTSEVLILDTQLLGKAMLT